MKTIKDTPGRDKETSKAHKVVFNKMINDLKKNIKHGKISNFNGTQWIEWCFIL